jgi:CheY-like chemotaxis protein
MSTPVARPRVVFVDDDASIRRLAGMVLEDLPIHFIACDSAAAARAALRAQPAALLITDLMMPGESGFDLLASLVADAPLRAGARLVVFSAGLNADTRARLADLDVWRELPKPVSLQALEDCVREALALHATPTPAGPSTSGPTPLTAAEERVVQAQFGGDAGLYTAFRDQVHRQWRDDLAEGTRLCAAADAPGLRRLAHSLKGVLALLGDDTGAAQARQLEEVAAAGDAAAATAGWRELAAHLRAVMAPGASARPGP